MTADDLTPITQALVAGVALLMTGLIRIYVPRIIAAFERRTDIQLTDQQKATLVGAATTEVGIIKMKLEQGALTMQDIKPDNPNMLAHATSAIDRVPDTAEKMNKTVPSMSETIVGMVGNSVASTPAAAPAIVPAHPSSPIPAPIIKGV